MVGCKTLCHHQQAGINRRMCCSITSDKAHVISSAVIELNNRASPKTLTTVWMPLCQPAPWKPCKSPEQWTSAETEGEVDGHRRDGDAPGREVHSNTMAQSGRASESLLADACTSRIRHQCSRGTPSLPKYFHTLLHKLEQEDATLVTAHESSIALEEALEG